MNTTANADCRACGTSGECNIATDASDFVVVPHQYCGLQSGIHYCCPFEHKGNEVECSPESITLCVRFIGTVSWTTIAAVIIPVFVVIGVGCLWYQGQRKKNAEAAAAGLRAGAAKPQGWIDAPAPVAGMQPIQNTQPMYGQAYPPGGYA